MKIDEKTFRSMRRMVVYLAPDEGRNYEEAGKPRSHIFRDVMRVARFLDSVERV